MQSKHSALLRKGGGGIEEGKEGDYLPVATLSSPECFLHSDGQ